MRRHLEQCAACAEQVKAIKGISTELGRLPVLDVHPAFVTRVMARVKESAVEKQRSWWSRFAVPMAMTASFFFLVGFAIVWRTMPSGTGNPAEGTSSMTSRLAEVMVGYGEAATDGEIWELDVDDSTTADELLAGVAQTDSFALLAKALDEETDLDTLVASLDGQEMAAFNSLVREYQGENLTL